MNLNKLRSPSQSQTQQKPTAADLCLRHQVARSTTAERHRELPYGEPLSFGRIHEKPPDTWSFWFSLIND